MDRYDRNSAGTNIPDDAFCPGAVCRGHSYLHRTQAAATSSPVDITLEVNAFDIDYFITADTSEAIEYAELLNSRPPCLIVPR